MDTVNKTERYLSHMPHKALSSNLASLPRLEVANAGPYIQDGTFVKRVSEGGLDNRKDPDVDYDPNEYSNMVAKAYVESIFPDVSVNLLSQIGNSAIILEDAAHDFVFKVRRDASHYSYFEDEMAALTIFHSFNMAPQPYLLLDTPIELRTDEPNRSRKIDFGNHDIVRQEGYGRFPIIVMERIMGAGMSTLPADKLADEFKKIAALLTVTGIILGGDAEPVYDIKKQRTLFLDLGGTEVSAQYGHDNSTAWRVKCMERLLMAFDAHGLDSDDIAIILHEHGIDGLADYVCSVLKK